MSNDWWSRALSGNAPQRPPMPRSMLPPMQPPPVVVDAPPTYQPQHQPEYRTDKAASQRQSSTCPECASGNYMQQSGGRPRCFDCGYPIVQSTSGIMADPGMASQPAQQVQTTYNPTIEGHLS